MGRRWFSAVKRVFSPESKEKKNEEKSRKKWGFGKSKETEQVAAAADHEGDSKSANAFHGTQSPRSSKKNVADVGDQHAFSIAIATAVAAEAAVVAARAAAEAVHLTRSLRSVGGGSREEIAAVKVQNAFRGYLARRRLQASKGMVKLKSLSSSNAVKCQTMNTLHCIQVLARVQSQVRARGIKLSEENQALHRQLKLKDEKELENKKMGEDWNSSLQSKEQMDATLQKKQEAAQRRERTLAYSYSRQWKSNSSRSKNSTCEESSNPQCEWSWLERWMSTRSWENSQNTTGERAHIRNSSSMNSTSGPRVTSHRLSRLPSRLSPSTASIRGKSPSTPPSIRGRSQCPATARNKVEDDRRSVRSERPNRRHSIGAAFSDVDDDGLLSSPNRGYLSSTESTRAKSRFQTTPAGDSLSKAGTLARKQLSFPPAEARGIKLSPAPKSRLSSLP